MQHTRRAFLTTAGSAAVAGCISRSVLDGGTERASVLLNWKPNGLHIPYYTAVENGYYEDAGLKIESVESGQGSDFAAKQTGMGNTEFAVSSSDQVLAVNSRDLSPVSVGVVMQRNPVVAFTSREHFEEPLEDVEQLAGATVGTGPGMVRLMMRAFFERHGILQDVEFVDTGWDTVQQLLSGEVDAAGGVFSDVVDARPHDSEIDTLAVADTIPSYGHVIVTNESYANDHPDAVRAFLQGTARGAAWAQQNPEAATDILVSHESELKTVRENQYDKWMTMSEQYIVSETVENHGWGWSVPEPWKEMHQTLEDGDFLDGTVDPNSVWTNEFLDVDNEYIGGYADRVS